MWVKVNGNTTKIQRQFIVNIIMIFIKYDPQFLIAVEIHQTKGVAIVSNFLPLVILSRSLWYKRLSTWRPQQQENLVYWAQTNNPTPKVCTDLFSPHISPHHFAAPTALINKWNASIVFTVHYRNTASINVWEQNLTDETSEASAHRKHFVVVFEKGFWGE